MTGTAADDRPLLLLDVDGVLLVLGESPEGKLIWLVESEVPAWLAELGRHYQLVWATTWEHRANNLLAPRFGLPSLPVIEFGTAARREGETRKLPGVIAYAGDRPLAWIDDSLEADAWAWADARPQPTLLLQPETGIGLTREHVDRAIAFANAIAGRY